MYFLFGVEAYVAETLVTYFTKKGDNFVTTKY